MTSKIVGFTIKKVQGHGSNFEKNPIKLRTTYFDLDVFITIGNIVFKSNLLRPTGKRTRYIEIIGDRKVKEIILIYSHTKII